MPIDPRMVKWDAAPKVDASMVKWDAEPAPMAASNALDAPNAVATGYNRGLLRLAGLPVDTIANVIDLGKAGLGSAYGAVTGKVPPEALQLGDRSNVVGSGEWLIKQAQGAATAVVNPANPEYEGGYLQNAGGALTAIMNPQTRAQLVNQAVLGLTGATAAKVVADQGGSPAAAVTASLLPGGAQQTATAGAKRIVRGDEAGRRNMAQRIQDLKNAGIDNPTLGLASGNKFIEGTENILQSAPGAVGVMRNARERIVGGLEAKVGQAADAASGQRGALEAGNAIQTGATTFRDDFKARQEALYNNLEAKIGSQYPTKVDATRAALATLNADIQGAPELSRFFKNARIQALEAAMKSDTAPPAPPPPPPQLHGHPPPPPPPPPAAALPLPFEAVKKTRTLVGDEIADNSLLSTVPRSKWNPLYGALSDDMQTAAAGAGPAATQAFDRANNYTRAGLDRLDVLRPFADKAAPEQAFKSLAGTLAENNSIFQAVKKSLPEGARGTVAGTIIERLGKATPGQQNAAGDAWSPETFLTNWNRMPPKGQRELLSGFPNSDQVRADIEAVAKATAMMRDGAKMWANPSGTAANMGARVTLGAGAAGALISPWAPVVAAGGMTANNLLARALTSRGVVNAAARPDQVRPELQAAQLNALFGTGALERALAAEKD